MVDEMARTARYYGSRGRTPSPALSIVWPRVNGVGPFVWLGIATGA